MVKECIRCGNEHDGGHLYCSACRLKQKKETVEEKAQRRLGWALLRQAQTKKRVTKRDKYGVAGAAIWASKVQNWKRIGILNPPETKEEYDEMVADNAGICPACRRPPRGGMGNGWHLHHDHKTGLVVGLVCTRCNMGMGQFEDSADLLMTVAYWLVQKEEEQKPLVVA